MCCNMYSMGNCQKSRQITNRHLLMNRYHSFCELNRKTRFRLNDFNDDILLKIFSMLNLREKLSVIRVCKRWQRLIKVTLQKYVSLKLGEHSVKCNCHCDHYPNWDFPPHKYFERDRLRIRHLPEHLAQPSDEALQQSQMH